MKRERTRDTERGQRWKDGKKVHDTTFLRKTDKEERRREKEKMRERVEAHPRERGVKSLHNGP